MASKDEGGCEDRESFDEWCMAKEEVWRGLLGWPQV